MPTQIRFGKGRINELKEILPSFGEKCLIVSRPVNGSLKTLYEKINKILKDIGISTFIYDGIVPNPTIDGVNEGIKIASKNNIDFVLGVGGGSVMDSAKLIAFLKNEDSKINWDEVTKKYSNPFKISEKPKSAVPFIAISTTSGSGSHCTQAAVVSDIEKKEKITVFHSGLFPSIAIVDPELMLTVPSKVSSATGFDVFAHAFESYLGNLTSPLTERMSFEAIKLVFEYLPKVIDDPENITYRSKMAWADTLAGMCLSNGGADLPHPLGEIIGGICPRISHGETLAIVYPEFLKYKENISPEKFNLVEKKTGLEKIGQPLTLKINELLKEINLFNAFNYSNISSNEMKLISNHPLLDLLQPENSSEIKNIMNNSLK
jgi:alcohol dehydrogenase class IV